MNAREARELSDSADKVGRKLNDIHNVIQWRAKVGVNHVDVCIDDDVKFEVIKVLRKEGYTVKRKSWLFWPGFFIVSW